MGQGATGRKLTPCGEGLRVEVVEHAGIITLDRPEKLNAMRSDFYKNLGNTFTVLESNPEVRVVIITGAGTRAFSVGGDIESFRELKTMVDKRNYQIEAMQGFSRVEQSPLPVISAVNGLALGGGCELTLACDFVLAAEHAQFGMPEAGLGLVPGYGVVRAPDVIGRQMTKMMIMTRQPISADKALKVGLVQDVVKQEALMDKALEFADAVALSSPLALNVGKRVVNRGMSIAEFDYSVEALTVLQSSDDTEEGTRAFMEKRQPIFQNLVTN